MSTEQIKPWALKHLRAEQLISELDSYADKYLEEKPYTHSTESWNGEVLVTDIRITGTPDPKLSPLIGDILHNQRSVLDSLFYALIEYKSDGRKSKFKSIARDLYFPVLNSAEELLEHKGVKEFGDDQLVKALQQFQPYTLVPDPLETKLRDSHYYKQLMAFSNLDKHRGVNLVHTVVDDLTLVHSGNLKYLSARALPSDDARHLRHEFHFEPLQEAPSPELDVKVSLALETPPGFSWVTKHSASSLLHTIQSQNNWFIAVGEYLLGGAQGNLIAQLYV